MRSQELERSPGEIDAEDMPMGRAKGFELAFTPTPEAPNYKFGRSTCKVRTAFQCNENR